MTRQEELEHATASTDQIVAAGQQSVTTDTDVGGDGPDQGAESLVDERESAAFQDRWNQVQSRFVDDPRAAVGDADALVAEVMQSVARGFAEHKAGLETQWTREEEPDTEQLRQALRRYRLFFSRLLST